MNRIALAALLLSVVMFSSCTLVTDFDECSSDADCSSGACVDGLCEGPAGCTVHDDCRTESNPTALCIANACRTLDESLCQADERLETSDAPLLHFGMLMPLTGRNGPKGAVTRDGAMVGLNRVNQVHGGVAQRDVSLISCDTLSDPAQATAAADHLVNDLGIRVVLGALLSDATIDVARGVTIDAGALLISPASTSPIITDLDDNDLVWRTVPSDIRQGKALAQIVASGEYGQVAVMFSNNNYGNGLFNVMQTELSASNPELLDDTRFQTISYEVTQGALEADALLERAQRLFETEGYQPDAIFILGSAESQNIIRSLDETYFGALDEADRPIWVLTDGGRDAGLFDTTFRDIWPRIIGTSPQEVDTPATTTFETFFEAESNTELEFAPFADNAFDAAFIAALVVGASADPVAPTPEEFAAGMKLVSAGEPYVATDPFGPAAEAIAAGTGIDYVGASGDVQFDPETGDVNSAIEGWAINGESRSFDSTGILVEAD